MEEIQHLINLVQGALTDLDDESVPVSRSVRRGIRVARLRNDWDDLYWLAMEVRARDDGEARKALFLEVAPHYTKEEFQDLHRRSVDSFLKRREIERLIDQNDPDNSLHILALPVPEIEARITHCQQVAADLRTPTHVESFDYMYMEDRNAGVRREALAAVHDATVVLERIRSAAHEYLSRAEAELYAGRQATDVFEHNRRYVERRLSVVAPNVLEQFRAAFERLQEGSSEARSHALTSCRRILKSLADVLYPARELSVVGPDGKERVLSDDKYVSRLWQFVHDSVSGTAARRLLEDRVRELGKRIDRLYDLSSKGVHDASSRFEVEQCVTQTYMLVGDLLRLHEGRSAVECEVPPDP